jgi:hypothetical protein
LTTPSLQRLDALISMSLEVDMFKFRMLYPSNMMLEMFHIMFEITNIENRGMNA